MERTEDTNMKIVLLLIGILSLAAVVAAADNYETRDELLVIVTKQEEGIKTLREVIEVQDRVIKLHEDQAEIRDSIISEYEIYAEQLQELVSILEGIILEYRDKYRDFEEQNVKEWSS